MKPALLRQRCDSGTWIFHEIQSEIVRLGPHSSAGLGRGMFAFKNLLLGYERAEKTCHGGSFVCAEI